MPAVQLLHILLVVFLVLTNAFFVAVEFALVSVRRTRLQQLSSQGSSRAVARTNDHWSIVTGPVSMPLTGRFVSD